VGYSHIGVFVDVENVSNYQEKSDANIVYIGFNLSKPTGYVMHQQFYPLKPTGYVMHQQFNRLSLLVTWLTKSVTL
jgi:hypothetical protein